LRGGDAILAHIEKKLGIKLGESTPDGKFYLKREEECLAALLWSANDASESHLLRASDPEKVDQVLNSLE